ncbi:MAG: glycogen synthase GlgA [Gammaproteobacteria bacterium]|nr:glycogen synthase GlgA [Gammaproteobacteria bacterium]MDH5592513.1 glycogen synthase GlgA [Gammaproteobacteria bacterium]
MRKILFASSEVHSLIKTGGLADVSASLPMALRQHDQDVRIIMPAYRQCIERLTDTQTVAIIKLDGIHEPVEILQSTLPDSDVMLWLVHSPFHFDRDGGPYSQPQGGDWEDNAARFSVFSRVIAAVAINQADLNWRPDILHCNDWQTGLAPALIAEHPHRPAIIFTIHNLAYQGLYSRDVFEALNLPEKLWNSEGLEFYGLMSFMKGGLIYADHITTVSPSYAEEICSYEFGYGLEGLLSYRAQQGQLTGILNGIDHNEWNSETDPYISKTYSIKTIRNKAVNKLAVQRYFSLPEKEEMLLMGVVSRLVSQKGIDLALDAVTHLLELGANIQLVCLGSGEPAFEQDLRVLRARFPDKVGVDIGYNEPLAHQIEAGVDVFLMPSRFEPCGLNQLYSLRYGTLPIVRNTGGLADTVVDAIEENRTNNSATGFKFELSTPEALEETLYRVMDLFKRPRIWRKMMVTAMEQDYSWENSAASYLQLYDDLLD